MQILQVKTADDFNNSQVPAGKLLVWLEFADGKAVFNCEDENGNVSQIGGDQFSKGYFATEAALNTAYPAGQAGWYAVVGETDTIWIWDTDTEAWVNSGASSGSSELAPVTLPTFGDVTIDASAGDKFILEPTGAINLSLSNFAVNQEVILKIKNGASNISWADYIKWETTDDYVLPTLQSNGVDFIRFVNVEDNKYVGEHFGTYDLSVVTSYDNTGGTGDRTSVITLINGDGATKSSCLLYYNAAAENQQVIDGTSSGSRCYNGDIPITGRYVVFDFGVPRCIQELKIEWYLQYSGTRVFCFEASTDKENWIALTESFSISDAGTATITLPFVNDEFYRYYRIVGVSGYAYYYHPRFNEIEFKISE